MSINENRSSASVFNRAAKKKASSPFSLRLSEDERALLRQRAGKRSLGDYIRSCLFGDAAKPSKRRTPRDRDIEYAKALAGLGRSELATNMATIANAAAVGALPVTPDLTEALNAACRDIRDMRDALIKSLGVKAK
ncbi:hypothetical protein [Maricaulis sp.]|uniref:hypothetical protein n=1 Tax=Maricaulis sp. TaxID=1486257 RepID=UPI00263328E7|nr:hypothetical protein [Maricaulis sp.]